MVSITSFLEACLEDCWELFNITNQSVFIAKCITKANSESHSSSIECQVCASLLELCYEMNDRWLESLLSVHCSMNGLWVPSEWWGKDLNISISLRRQSQETSLRFGEQNREVKGAKKSALSRNSLLRMSYSTGKQRDKNFRGICANGQRDWSIHSSTSHPLLVVGCSGGINSLVLSSPCSGAECTQMKSQRCSVSNTVCTETILGMRGYEKGTGCIDNVCWKWEQYKSESDKCSDIARTNKH